MLFDSGSSEPKPLPHTAIKFAQLPEEQDLLRQRSDKAEQEFRSVSLDGHDLIIADLRGLHRTLYQGLCKVLPEAVGEYRGTPGTSIADAQRVVRVRGSAKGLKRTDQCAPPSRVAEEMNTLLHDIRRYWAGCSPSDAIAQIADFTFRFYWIHPFLDGNGHVWRLATIALARRAKLRVLPDWTVMQRPYDAAFSLGLQNFRQNPTLLENELARFLKKDEP